MLYRRPITSVRGCDWLVSQLSLAGYGSRLKAGTAVV